MKTPHLTALICVVIAAVFYYMAFSPEYSGAFVLLAGFFELVAWKKVFGRSKT